MTFNKTMIAAFIASLGVLVQLLQEDRSQSARILPLR